MIEILDESLSNQQPQGSAQSLKDGDEAGLLEGSPYIHAMSRIRSLLSPGYTSLAGMNASVLEVGYHPLREENPGPSPIPDDVYNSSITSGQTAISEIITILQDYQLLPSASALAVPSQNQPTDPTTVSIRPQENDPLNNDILKDTNPSPQKQNTLHPLEPAKCSHVDDFTTIQRDLMKACESGIGKETIYKGVYVLLMSWGPADDLGVASELDLLDEVFTDRYDFKVDRFSIPNKPNATAYVSIAIEGFQLNYNDPENLYIIYYGGHGRLGTDQCCYFHPNGSMKDKDNWVDWNSIQRQLETAQQDALILLDCCSAGASVTRRGALPSVTEVLGAGAREVEAPGVNLSSFTQRILYELWYTKEDILYVDKIAEKLVTEAKTEPYETQPFWWPVNGRDAHSIGLKVAKPEAAPKYPEKLRLHKMLQPPPTANGKSALLVPENDDDGSSSSQLAWKSQTDPTDMTASEMLEPHGHKALISIRLSKNLLPVQIKTLDWANWLKKAPEGMEALEDISFESLHDSGSSLLIVSIPVRSWLHLRDDPAYSFIGFVRSINLLRTTSIVPGISTALDNQLLEIREGLKRIESYHQKAEDRQIKNFDDTQTILDKLSTHLNEISEKVQRTSSFGASTSKKGADSTYGSEDERRFSGLRWPLLQHGKEKQKSREMSLQNFLQEIGREVSEMKDILVEFKVKLNMETSSELVKERRHMSTGGQASSGKISPFSQLGMTPVSV